MDGGSNSIDGRGEKEEAMSAIATKRKRQRDREQAARLRVVQRLAGVPAPPDAGPSLPKQARDERTVWGPLRVVALRKRLTALEQITYEEWQEPIGPSGDPQPFRTLRAEAESAGLLSFAGVVKRAHHAFLDRMEAEGNARLSPADLKRYEAQKFKKPVLPKRREPPSYKAKRRWDRQEDPRDSPWVPTGPGRWAIQRSWKHLECDLPKTPRRWQWGADADRTDDLIHAEVTRLRLLRGEAPPAPRDSRLRLLRKKGPGAL